jgi:hypothetical protein
MTDIRIQTNGIMNNIEETERTMNDNVRGSQTDFNNFENSTVYHSDLKPTHDF